MKRERVEAQLRNLERLIDDPPPLLSLVIVANGTGILVAHPMFMPDGRTLEEHEAALRLVHTALVGIAANFEQEIDRVVRASAKRP